MTPDLTQSIEKLVRDHHLAVEAWTEAQLVEVIRQIMLSGDIVKYVLPSSDYCSETSRMVYLPFGAVEHLRSRVRILEKALNDNGLEP